MKCPECGGAGFFLGLNGFFTACLNCDGTGEIPITNEEWRKNCSVEEFAEWISNLAYACMRCGMNNSEAYCHTGHCIQDEADAEKWLRQQHIDKEL